jgi:hypothetical protein
VTPPVGTYQEAAKIGGSRSLSFGTLVLFLVTHGGVELVVSQTTADIRGLDVLSMRLQALGSS